MKRVLVAISLCCLAAAITIGCGEPPKPTPAVPKKDDLTPAPKDVPAKDMTKDKAPGK